jgi:hypothetical protein
MVCCMDVWADLKCANATPHKGLWEHGLSRGTSTPSIGLPWLPSSAAARLLMIWVTGKWASCVLPNVTDVPSP